MSIPSTGETAEEPVRGVGFCVLARLEVVVDDGVNDGREFSAVAGLWLVVIPVFSAACCVTGDFMEKPGVWKGLFFQNNQIAPPAKARHNNPAAAVGMAHLSHAFGRCACPAFPGDCCLSAVPEKASSVLSSTGRRIPVLVAGPVRDSRAAASMPMSW